jgi:hypothetical protein
MRDNARTPVGAGSDETDKYIYRYTLEHNFQHVFDGLLFLHKGRHAHTHEGRRSSIGE